MKKYKLIMSDLDNTLLPIYTQEKFADMWFKDIGRKFIDHGLDPKRCLEGMNSAVRAMVYNESGKKNIEVFYEKAEQISGYPRDLIAQVADDYYTTTFENVYDLTLPNPYAPVIAGLMRSKAEHAVIATMPIFTIEAVTARLRWIGLTPDMFDHVTTAENSSYCKPNTNYFTEILDRFSVKPREALMIGNDVREDMQPCKALGIDTFLVTDHIITHKLPYSEYRQGSYAELVSFLENLPDTDFQ